MVLDALTYAANPSSLDAVLARQELTFVHGDIRTPGLAEQLLRKHRVTTIVHFAAESHVDRSIHGPDAFVETNVLGTHALLKAARQVWWEIPMPPPRRASTTFPRTRCSGHSAHPTRLFEKTACMLPTRPMRRARPRRIIWFAPTTHLRASRHHQQLF